MAALNALYQHDLAVFHDLCLPSVKLQRKERVGRRLRRHYDVPRTPLERLQDCPDADPAALRRLRQPREHADPFALAERIDRHVEHLFALATPARRAPLLRRRPPSWRRLRDSTTPLPIRCAGRPVGAAARLR